LRHRLAEENGERDAARLAWRRLVRTVDVYRQRLVASAGFAVAGDSHEATGELQRVRELVQSMDAETQASALLRSSAGTSDAAQAAFPEQSHEVLRQALEEAQRRCDSLNLNMVQQAEANDELVEALGTVKDANKRLLEQLRLQTDEIAQLTEQRICDEERMDFLGRRHQGDETAMREESLRRMGTLREEARGKSEALQRRFVERLRNLRGRLESACQEAARAREQKQELRRDAAMLTYAFQAQWKAASEETLARCAAFAQAYDQRRQRVQESIRALESELSKERELRQSEGLSWSHRQSSLSADVEDVKARMARDVSQLTSQMQAFERTLAAERQSWLEENSHLDVECANIESKRRSRQHDLEHLQGESPRLEAAMLGVGSEVQTKERVVAELRRQVRESHDALAAAVSGNEHLRLQLEEQRKRFQEENESDLAGARGDFERQLGAKRLAQEGEAAVAGRHLQAMEEAKLQQEEALQALHVQIDATVTECESLERDSAMWSSQHDVAKVSRQALEKELTEARQSAALERMQLQAATGQGTVETAAIQGDVQKVEEHLEDFRRTAGAWETDHGTRLAAAEAALKDEEQELAEFKRRLCEADEARARAEDEAAARRQAADVEAALARVLETRRGEAAEARERLANTLSDLQQGSKRAREDLEKERESGTALLRRAQDETRSKLGFAEHSRVRAEESCRASVEEAGEDAAQKLKQCDALEHDLSRIKYLLNESEANLAWVRQELEREDCEGSSRLHQLTEEVATARAALEKAVSEEVALGRQLEETVQRNDQERDTLKREAEELRRATAREAADAEARWQRTRTVCDFKLQGLETPGLRAAEERQRAQEESLEQENSELRSLIAEQGRSSLGLSSLHNQLESRIQRLQRHTEELRSSLHTSGAVALGAPPMGSAHEATPERLSGSTTLRAR